MSLSLSDECIALRAAARSMLSRRASVQSLRRLRDQKSAAGYARDVWIEMVELGWSGLLVPEAHGGAGLGYREMGVLLQECGRQLTPSPLVSSALLGAVALTRGGSQEMQEALLPGVASGRTLLALAHDEGPHHHALPTRTIASRSERGFRLRGDKHFVLDGHIADHLIVTARAEEGADILILLVDATLPGVSVTRADMVDSHNMATVRLQDVEVGEAQRLAAPGADGARGLVRHLLDAGRAGVIAQMLGGAEEAFERTLAYLKERTQFGVAIGSFQALQHRAAVMFCELELSKSMVLDALAALDEDRDDAAMAVSAAKVQLCETFRRVSCEAIQMHGGVGMTDEHEIGFFLKRARVLEHSFGGVAFHAERFATLSGY